MTWLLAFGRNFLEWANTPQGMGVIAGAILAVIIPLLIHTVRKLILKFVRCLVALPRRGWRMIVRWVAKKRYGLGLSIIGHSNLSITKVPSGYQMDIKARIKFKGRFDAYSSQVTESNIGLEVDNLQRGITHETFELYWFNAPAQRGFSLKADDVIEREYSFSRICSEKPHLGDQARCWIAIGYVYLRKVDNTLVKRKFTAEVIDNATP